MYISHTFSFIIIYLMKEKEIFSLFILNLFLSQMSNIITYHDFFNFQLYF